MLRKQWFFGAGVLGEEVETEHSAPPSPRFECCSPKSKSFCSFKSPSISSLTSYTLLHLFSTPLMSTNPPDELPVHVHHLEPSAHLSPPQRSTFLAPLPLLKHPLLVPALALGVPHGGGLWPALFSLHPSLPTLLPHHQGICHLLSGAPDSHPQVSAGHHLDVFPCNMSGNQLCRPQLPSKSTIRGYCCQSSASVKCLLSFLFPPLLAPTLRQLPSITSTQLLTSVTYMPPSLPLFTLRPSHVEPRIREPFVSETGIQQRRAHPAQRRQDSLIHNCCLFAD